MVDADGGQSLNGIANLEKIFSEEIVHAWEREVGVTRRIIGGVGWVGRRAIFLGWRHVGGGRVGGVGVGCREVGRYGIETGRVWGTVASKHVRDRS